MKKKNEFCGKPVKNLARKKSRSNCPDGLTVAASRREPFFKPNLKHLALLTLFLFIATTQLTAQISDWEREVRLKARKAGDGFFYTSLQQVAKSLNAHTYYSSKVRKAVLYLGEDKVIVTAFNPFVLVNSRVVQMPIATRFDDGDIWLPVKFFVPILRHTLGTATAANGDIQPGSGANLFGVHVDEKANGTLIRVNTAGRFKPSSLSTRFSKRWLYLDILGGKLAATSFVKSINSTEVSEVVPVQLQEMVQLSFHLKRSVAEKNLQLSQQQNEIWISIPSKEGLSADVIKKLQEEQKKWRIDKIVIDPGHGGRDPGTSGPNGVREKDVVLAIAKKLKRIIERNMTVKVLMTRDKDEYIALEERTRFANKNEGKLFISIHANWNRNATVSGATTYFLGLAKSDESLEISQRENAVIKYDDRPSSYGKMNDERIILATMAQNSYNKESQDFAGMIQKHVSGRTKLRNRGVKQAGFYVMVGASMPNVLIETAFMSNRKEEKLLKKASFQEKVARGIYDSIKNFKDKYESTMY